MLSSTVIVFAILWFTSFFLLSGVPRRDHPDRSVEFWMSLPTSPSASLGAPMLVHLLVVPATALLVGLLGGLLVSAVTVTRVSGLAAWFDLPWMALLPALLAMFGRVLVGLPLATLWLLPMVMLVMLATALLRRWGIPLLAIVLGMGNLILDKAYGITFFSDIFRELVTQAGRALVLGGDTDFRVSGPEDVASALQSVPGWAMNDLGHALANLASPTLLGGLVFAALCFALLVQWRRRSV
jgi:ABC-2 type transport system permease protein